MTVHNLAADVDAFTSNAFLVEGAQPALVDAGAGFDIVARIDDVADASPEVLVLTHTHPDHVGTVEDLIAAFELPVIAYDDGVAFVDEAIDEGDEVTLGDHDYAVWYTPGHAPDHCCLYAGDAGHLFSGDVLMPNGGVGRTDLPGGDPEALAASLERILEEVDASLTGLYAGHGPAIEGDAYRHIELAGQVLR